MYVFDARFCFLLKPSYRAAILSTFRIGFDVLKILHLTVIPLNIKFCKIIKNLSHWQENGSQERQNIKAKLKNVNTVNVSLVVIIVRKGQSRQTKAHNARI
jgi:hypothetical protein